MAERSLHSEIPVNLALTLSPLGRGRGDPTHRHERDGSIVRASRLVSGPVTYRIWQIGRHDIRAQAWGAGAAEFLDGLERFLCLDEDLSDFAPAHPKIAEAHRRFPDLRMVRTGRVFESLVPAILEQKVHGIAARSSWRKLVTKYGEPAPGPHRLTLPPPAEVWRMIPSWEYHRANVDPQRSRTIVAAAKSVDQLEAAATMDRTAAEKRLRMIPGIGVWTAAEVGQRALGDGDALSVGDFHLAAMVGWTLEGRPFDDDEMVEYLNSVRPHRYRAVRLLEVAGFAFKPKFGPRTAVTDHTWH
ncbi:MAG: DNA-3-methyladenine glycosylase 2 family protein [Nocardiaceae bacterium]|nr:DNA-3-methyladenine glycosylase 2 family protein [Nocardiaceae bacterium]